MAVKIMETKTGKVTMTSKQNKRDRAVRKVQKYISVAAVVMMMLIMSAVTVFAAGTTGAAANGQPSGVDTTTMNEFGGIVWWLVRIVILAIGGIPGVINLVKGLSDQDDRQRNIGLIVLVVTGAAVAATFALSGVIGF